MLLHPVSPPTVSASRGAENGGVLRRLTWKIMSRDCGATRSAALRSGSVSPSNAVLDLALSSVNSYRAQQTAAVGPKENRTPAPFHRCLPSVRTNSALGRERTVCFGPLEGKSGGSFRCRSYVCFRPIVDVQPFWQEVRKEVSSEDCEHRPAQRRLLPIPTQAAQGH